MGAAGLSAPPVIPSACQTSIPNEQELLKLGIDPEAYCELCKKEFCSKYFLKTHRANIHGIRTPATTAQTTHATPAIGSSPLAWPGLSPSLDVKRQLPQWPGLDSLPGVGLSICDICSAEFANGYALKMHVFAKHGRYMNTDRSPLVAPPPPPSAASGAAATAALLQSQMMQSPLNVAALMSAVHGMHGGNPPHMPKLLTPPAMAPVTPTPATPATMTPAMPTQAVPNHAVPPHGISAGSAGMAVTNGAMGLASVMLQPDQPIALNMSKVKPEPASEASMNDTPLNGDTVARRRSLIKRLKRRYGNSLHNSGSVRVKSKSIDRIVKSHKTIYACDVCESRFNSAVRCRRHRAQAHATSPCETPVSTSANITQRFRVEDLSGRILSDVKLSIPLAAKQGEPLTNPLQVHLYPLVG